MFNIKKIREKEYEISKLKGRIYELEELLCPFNQHEFVEIDHVIVSDFDCGQIDSHCERTLQCKKCRKIVRDSDKITGFKYKTADEK